MESTTHKPSKAGLTSNLALTIDSVVRGLPSANMGGEAIFLVAKLSDVFAFPI